MDHLDRLERLEHHLRSDRFAEFTRGALQDNIILCDQKAGILLAFSSALVLFCAQSFGDVHPIGAPWNIKLSSGLLVLSAVGFIGSCYFALMSVAPRIRKGPDDHIFWGSSAYDVAAEIYIDRFENADPDKEMRDKLRHLHTLAGICRDKYGAFKHGLRLALISFFPLVFAEMLRALH